MNNTWEIRSQGGRSFYQDRLEFTGSFEEAIAFAQSRYKVIGKTVSIHRPREPYAFYWINLLGEVNRMGGSS